MLEIEKYNIKVLDHLNFIIEEKCIIKKDTKKSKKGDVYFKTVGYFRTIEQAIIFLFDRSLIEESHKDIKDLYITIKDTKKYLSELCDKICKEQENS